MALTTIIVGEDQLIIAAMAGMVGDIMDPIQSSDFPTLVTTLLPMVIGPVVTAIFKRLMPSIPAAWKPILSAVIGALTGVFSGPAAAGPVADAAVGFALGLGGSKGRDLLRGKPNTSTVPCPDKINEDKA